MADEPRFIVASVTGVNIVPDTGISGGSSHRVPTSYYVLDRGYAHRCVASFNAIGGMTDDARKQRAEAKCAELNAWDADLT